MTHITLDHDRMRAIVAEQVHYGRAMAAIQLVYMGCGDAETLERMDAIIDTELENVLNANYFVEFGGETHYMGVEPEEETT